MTYGWPNWAKQGFGGAAAAEVLGTEDSKRGIQVPVARSKGG
jgi:hypothetical protein